MEILNIGAALSAPFASADIQWRVGSTTKDKAKGQALGYVDARAVMDRLDDAVGPGNWYDTYTASAAGNGIQCAIFVKIDGEWVGKMDAAQFEKPDESKPNEIDMRLKGAYSDAFKRAAVKWGIGRYLYKLDAVWVPLKDGRYITENPKLPEWALPDSEKRGGNKARPVATKPAIAAVPDAPAPSPAPAKSITAMTQIPEGVSEADAKQVNAVINKIKAGKGEASKGKAYLDEHVSAQAATWGAGLIDAISPEAVAA